MPSLNGFATRHLVSDIQQAIGVSLAQDQAQALESAIERFLGSRDFQRYVTDVVNDGLGRELRRRGIF